MDRIIVYEKFNVEEDYIGKPIACDLLFKDQGGNEYALTIYDNRTYCITHPAQRDYKRISTLDIEANDEAFDRIDPGFRMWLVAQLQEHYEL